MRVLVGLCLFMVLEWFLDRCDDYAWDSYLASERLLDRRLSNLIDHISALFAGGCHSFRSSARTIARVQVALMTAINDPRGHKRSR